MVTACFLGRDNPPHLFLGSSTPPSPVSRTRRLISASVHFPRRRRPVMRGRPNGHRLFPFICAGKPKIYWKQSNLNTPRKRESVSLYLTVMGKHVNVEEVDSVPPITEVGNLAGRSLPRNACLR
jgi:hypothetical protein